MQLTETHNDLRSLANRHDISLSLKFGFIGLGMGGCSIAAECADISTRISNNHYPYSALLINTNQTDFSKINTDNPNIKELPLKGYEKGAGRDIDLGRKAFVENQEMIQASIKRQFEDRDFIFIVAGLGGGTGTGSVTEAMKLLHKSGFQGRIGLILTLPRNKEGHTVLSNAVERVKQIYKAMEAFGSIIVVDNQKLYDQFVNEKPNSKVEDYISFSNRYVAQTLHGINVVSNSFDPYGDNHFDASELLNMLKTPGVLSLSKVSLNNDQIELGTQNSYLAPLEDSIKEGILSDGYNFKKTQRAAVSIIANPVTANRIFQLSFVDNIENKLEEYAPYAGEKPVATYVDENTNKVDFYSLFAGLDLPKRIAEIVKEHERQQTIMEDDEDDEVANALASFQRSDKQNDIVDVDSLFEDDDTQDSSSNTETESKEEYDPLKHL